MHLSSLPEDILLATFRLCEVKALLRVERTCRTLRGLVLTHQVWLAQLRRLDRAHAPNLPLHVDVRTLKADALRAMVIKAVQGYENWRNGNLSEDNSVCVELKDPPLCGTPAMCEGDGIAEIMLVPGGKFLFARWTHGFVQLVDIGKNTAVWTYPDPLSIEEPSSECLMRVWSYDVDFRDDGGAALAACSWDKKNTEMLVEVFDFEKEYQSGSRRLFSKRIDLGRPLKADIHMQGDLLVVLSRWHYGTDSILTIVDFMSDHIVFAKVDYKYENPRAVIIRGHIFLSTHRSSEQELPLYGVADVRHLIANLREDDRALSVSTAVDIKVLGLTSYELGLPSGYAVETYGSISPPSLCILHWKEERDRACELLIDVPVENEYEVSYGSVFNRYAFTPRRSETEPPALTLLSSTEMLGFGFDGELALYRLRPRARFSVAGRFVMLRGVYRGADLETEAVLTAVYAGSRHGGPRSLFRIAPKWPFEAKWDVCALDHLSGALIFTCGDTRIRIVYPA